KCEICVEGKKIQNKLNSIISKERQTNDEKKLCKKLQKRVELYLKHKKSAEHQQTSLLKQKDNLQDNQAIIIIDFSANIILNKDANIDISREYYDNCQRTLFGVVMYWKEDGELKQHYFDIFSDYTTKNSYFVAKALDSIFNNE